MTAVEKLNAERASNVQSAIDRNRERNLKVATSEG